MVSVKVCETNWKFNGVFHHISSFGLADVSEVVLTRMKGHQLIILPAFVEFMNHDIDQLKF